MKKMSRTSRFLVPFAVAAMGAVALFLAGCDKKPEGGGAVDPSSPRSYMNDKAFRQQLKDRKKAAIGLGEAREEVTARQDALIAAKGEAMKTGDRAKIVAALAGDAEWQALEAKAKELDEAFMKHHRETMRVVRERIAPKGKATSK